MKKLRLDLDAVVVETFHTAPDRVGRKGTVDGQAARPAASNGYGLDGCTVGGCSGDGGCSWNMDCSVVNCSDDCTGYPGCSNDGNCSELEGCTGLTVCFWTP